MLSTIAFQQSFSVTAAAILFSALLRSFAAGIYYKCTRVNADIHSTLPLCLHTFHVACVLM